MPRIYLPGLLLIILLLGGLATMQASWLGLAAMLAVYLLAAMLSAPQELELSVSRTLSGERAHPGQPVQVQLQITNKGDTLRELLLCDPLPKNSTLISGSNQRMVSLKKGESLLWSYTFSGKRGFHAFTHIEASASDPFGLHTVKKEFPTTGQVLILPVPPKIRRVVIRTRATRVYAGTIPARLGGAGVDFFGVREYQRGDPQSAVNWRVSARHTEALFANEFEQERVADVGIIVDGRLSVNQLGEHLSIFDSSILAAASLSDAFLSAGNRVGLLVYGQYINWTYPGYGKRQQERIMHALARAVPGDNQAFASISIPHRLFPPNSQIVFISPLSEEDITPLINLRAGGYAVIIISPNAIQMECAHLPQTSEVQHARRILTLQRQVILTRLRHSGAQVLDWDVSQPFEKLVESSLSRPPSYLRAISTHPAD